MKILLSFKKRRIVMLLFILIAGCQAAPVERTSEQYIKDLHSRAIVSDLHNDLISKIFDDGVDIGIRNQTTHLDIPKINEGGIDFLLCAAWPSPKIEHYHQSKHVFDMIDGFFSALDKYPGKIELALTAADIRRITATDKIAVMVSIEGGQAIEEDLAMLRMFHRIGVRSLTLTWMNNTKWADSSNPNRAKFGTKYFQKIPVHNGLTDFGRKVIREMNRLGMIVDVSHASDKTTWDVLEVSTKPIIASHSSAYGVSAHFRNINDDLLRAIAKNNGVIGVNFYPSYVDKEFNNRLKKELSLLVKPGDSATRIQRTEAGRLAAPPLSLIMEHINYMVKVAGIDHIALGSDFDGIEYTPQGLEDGTKLINITRELVRQGYLDEDILKIMGGNVMRVIEEIIGR